MNRPTTFISYAYDSPEHKRWVRQLADDLISRYGVPVLLDQYELEAGHELTYFMESALERADKVLVILTPGYKSRAGDRLGGAGFEYSMISKEMMATQVGSAKFIPVLRAGTLEEAAPLYVQGRLFHDMRAAEPYEPQLFKLAKRLYDEPDLVKPTLGPVPDFGSTAIDPNLHELQQLSAAQRETERLTEILNSPAGLARAIAEARHVFELLREKSSRYKEAAPGFGFYFEGNEQYGEQQCRIVAGRHTVMVFWRQAYDNVVEGSSLRIVYLPGIIPFNFGQLPPSERPKHPLREKIYSFDLGPREQPQWVAAKTFYSSEDLVQEIFSFLVEKVKLAQQKA